MRDPCASCRFYDECDDGEDMGDLCPFCDADSERAERNLSDTAYRTDLLSIQYPD